MRVIHKASLAFLLKDIYSKMPVSNAVILCNGKQNPYTHKKSGHYVFSNLYPGEYEISISCKGYNSLNFPVTLRENETKEIVSDLSYSVDNQDMMRITRIEAECRHGKKLLKNAGVRLRLKNELSFLKLIEPTPQGSDVLKLNVEMITGLLGQNYVYEFKKQMREIFFWGYDQEKKAYISRDFQEAELEPGGKFYVFWDVKTDSKGRLIMPIMPQFMKESVLKFELTSGEIRSNIEIDISGKENSGQAIYADASFRKMRKRKAEV